MKISKFVASAVVISILGVVGCCFKTKPKGLDQKLADITPIADNLRLREVVQEGVQNQKKEDLGLAQKEDLFLVDERMIKAAEGFFEFDKAVLSNELKQRLDFGIARINAMTEEEAKVAELLVIGNCDERGSFEYNDLLGMRRATSVLTYVHPKLNKSFAIVLKSYGKRNLASKIHEKNRRVDVYEVMKKGE